MPRLKVLWYISTAGGGVRSELTLSRPIRSHVGGFQSPAERFGQFLVALEGPLERDSKTADVDRALVDEMWRVLTHVLMASGRVKLPTFTRANLKRTCISCPGAPSQTLQRTPNLQT